VRQQPTFTLPGNPTSAFVTFEVLVRPFLRQLGGHSQTTRRRVTCKAGEVVRAPAKLTYFLRVALSGSGRELTAQLTGPQGSGLVSGLAHAAGLAVVPEQVAEIPAGGELEVMVIDA
jgi:molybdopterin molybdotransferase